MKVRLRPLPKKVLPKKFQRDIFQNLLIVELVGGFGNQLFQLACGLNFAIRHRRTITFVFKDVKRKSELKRLGISEGQIYTISVDAEKNVLTLQKTNLILSSTYNPDHTYSQSSFCFESIDNPAGSLLIRGYFQSPRYFEENQEPILDYFRSRISQRELISEIQANNNAVMVHVRLGDMQTEKVAKEFHGIMPESYFLSALKEFSSECEVIVVTDSPNSFEETYPLFSKSVAQVISKDLVGDFLKLMFSKRLIISNSTFSWWAGYLSKAKVVAPIHWFTPDVLKENPTIDLIPKNWIQL